MPPKLLMAGFLLICSLAAQNEPAAAVPVSKTERLDLAPSGAVRLAHSTGELTIEGWDQPGVEITTIKTAKAAHGPQEPESAGHERDQLPITAERRGDDVVITTTLPKRRMPLLPRNAGDIDVAYVLKMPRKAHLIVDHGEGEVHLEGLAGDIDALVHRGLITLRLPPDAQYQVDAQTRLGGIYSDFPGNPKHRFWRVGNRLLEPLSAAAPKLHLRVGYGDIMILKMAQPVTATAAAH